MIDHLINNIDDLGTEDKNLWQELMWYCKEIFDEQKSDLQRQALFEEFKKKIKIPITPH